MILIFVAMNADLAFSEGPKASESQSTFDNHVFPLIKKYCVNCHGPKVQKSELRFDTLNPDMANGKDAETWQLLLDQLNLGEMPPRKQPQPKANERRILVNWLTDSLKHAAETKKHNAEVLMRRLTRQQYTNTLRDLLSVDIDFGKELPDEGLSTDGFKNNGETQIISLLQTEYYMKIAKRALDKAIPTEGPGVSYRYLYKFGSGIGKSEKKGKDFKKKGLAEVPVSNNDYTVHTYENRHPDKSPDLFTPNDLRRRCYADLRGAKKGRYSIEKQGMVLKPATPHVEKGSSIWLAPQPSLILQLREFPTEGNFVFRVKVAKSNPNEKQDAYIKAFIGERLDHGHDFKSFEQSRKVTGTPDNFQTIEFRGRLENFPVPIFDPRSKDTNTMMILGVWNDCIAKSSSDSSPAIIIKSMELIAPLIETWPPESHQRIFSISTDNPTEQEHSKHIIQSFMARAFRRPVTLQEVDSYYNHWKEIRPNCSSFEVSIKQTLSAILCSPNFLYLVESQERANPKDSETINSSQLANRLSYFLWNSMPDDELLDLARNNNFTSHLPTQVERMIQDPKSKDFVESFCSQWLQIEKMKEVRIDRGKFPKFNRFVRNDMIRETHLFFQHVLKENLSIMSFFDSDFTFVNQNLGQYYGMKNIKGGQFRKVSLEPNLNRGGLLTQGIFLTGNSNGKEPHPIKRGVWLTSRLLDDPPPPPPPNVPQIDEDDPNFASLPIKKQLEKHRNNPSCADCHNKIDPWGLLFESYNAAGLWHSNESEAMLSNGKTLNGVKELKEYLLHERKEEFARSLVRQLSRYALGRSLSFTDNADIDKIVQLAKKEDYRFKSLLTALITSPLFAKK